MAQKKFLGEIGLIDIDSQEYYDIGPLQILVPLSVLTKYGLIEYENACKRAESEQPKSHIEDGYIEYISSGIWIPDDNSRFYQEGDDVVINYFTDKVLVGKENGKKIVTSKIKWFGKNKKGIKWIITQNNSLYTW